MKNKLLAIAVVLTYFVCGNAKADNIDQQTAQQLGAYYFSLATGAKAEIPADKLVLAERFDNPTLCIPAVYVFNVSNGGFVVVSANNCVEPILAYSTEGEMDVEHMNPACRSMLEDYAQMISQYQNSESSPAADINAKWEQLINRTYRCDLSQGTVLSQTKAGDGTYLMNSKWDQGDLPIATYNFFCPKKKNPKTSEFSYYYDYDSLYCYAGCGPVAMAMIFHFWKYPTQGKGIAKDLQTSGGKTLKFNFDADSNQFLYSNMKPGLTYNSTYKSKSAVAKLIYATGIAMHAQYGISGTSVTKEYLNEALTKYFQYSSDFKFVYREGYYSGHAYTDNEWKALLINELDNGRPMYYTAADPGGQGRDGGGHAFVVDGINNDSTKFHINWGWGGSSNGYFCLTPASAIGSAGGYTFSQYHGVGYNIHPKTESIDDMVIEEASPAYPNPASEYIMIPVNLAMNTTLFVYDVDGRMVQRVIIPGGTPEYRLDVQSYPTGTYLYRLNGETFKFLVK